MNDQQCCGHHNDFVHLNEGLGGLDELFDLGEKIIEEPYFIDPSHPPGRPPGDPYLHRYISYVHLESRREGTLQYGLTRTPAWAARGHADASDIALLRERNRDQLTQDLREVERRREPDASRGVKFV